MGRGRRSTANGSRVISNDVCFLRRRAPLPALTAKATSSRRRRRPATEKAVLVASIGVVSTSNALLRARKASRMPAIVTTAVIAAKRQAFHNTHRCIALAALVVSPLANQKSSKPGEKRCPVLERLGQENPGLIERRSIKLDPARQLQLFRDGARAPKSPKDILDQTRLKLRAPSAARAQRRLDRLVLELLRCLTRLRAWPRALPLRPAKLLLVAALGRAVSGRARRRHRRRRGRGRGRGRGRSPQRKAV